jgi:hypothetical protein
MIIPLPKHDESDPLPTKEVDYEWIRWYINCPNWTCVECGAVMFGRVLACVYCKTVFKKHTPRPTSYPPDTSYHHQR